MLSVREMDCVYSAVGSTFCSLQSFEEKELFD